MAPDISGETHASDLTSYSARGSLDLISTGGLARRHRWRRLGTWLSVLLITTACDRSPGSATSPSATPQAVGFTGTMGPAGFAVHDFRATLSGQLKARLTADREVSFILVDTSVGCGPPWSGGCRPLARPPSSGSAEIQYQAVRGFTYAFAVWQLPEATSSQPYTLDVVVQ